MGVCAGRTGRPGEWANSQTPTINGTFLGFRVSVSCFPGAPAGVTSRTNGWFPPLISCWQKEEAQVNRWNLKLQVEREGSMDWITLLIPIKLAVFCFFLWYGFNYLWGWNSTSSREVHAASAWTDAAGSRGLTQLTKLPNSLIYRSFILVHSGWIKLPAPGSYFPP